MKNIFLLLLSMLPVTVLAHEGQHTFHDFPLHYITNGWHLFTILAFIMVVCWTIFNRFYKIRNRSPK